MKSLTEGPIAAHLVSAVGRKFLQREQIHSQQAALLPVRLQHSHRQKHVAPE